MASSFYWTEKARRRSCHRRNDSVEIDVFEAERYFSAANESLGHRGSTLTHKIGFSTRNHQLGHGRVSLDLPSLTRNHHHQNPFLETLNPPKDKKKHKSPTSPGGKLASFFNSLISPKKKKQSKPSSHSVKDLVEDESPSGWRRKRRSSISSTAASFSAAFASRKPSSTTTTTTPRVKRTSMSDFESRSIESCGFRTPPPCLNPNGFKLPKGLSEPHVAGSERRRSSPKESKEFKRLVEEDDGGDSDSSSDLFELKLNYDHHQLGYCGGGLPVYESTHMDSIKISSSTPITNGPFRS